MTNKVWYRLETRYVSLVRKASGKNEMISPLIYFFKRIVFLHSVSRDWKFIFKTKFVDAYFNSFTLEKISILGCRIKEAFRFCGRKLLKNKIRLLFGTDGWN